MGILDVLARRRAEKRIERKAKQLWSPPKPPRTSELSKKAERIGRKAMITSMTLHERFLTRKDEGRMIVEKKLNKVVFGKNATLKQATREFLYGKKRRRR